MKGSRRKPSEIDPGAYSSRVPPHSEEAEQAVLGSLLLGDRKDLAAVIKQGAKPEWFYLPAHRIVADAILKMERNGAAIDTLTVLDRLETDRVLEQVGGHMFLHKMTDNASIPGHFLDHVRIVQQKFLLRQMITLVRTGESEAYEVASAEDNVEDLVNKLRVSLGDLMRQESPSQDRTIPEVAKSLGDKYRQAKEKGFRIDSVPCRLYCIDRKLKGFIYRQPHVIAARPGCGKTTFLLNQARYSAEGDVREGIEPIPVGIISLEMTDEQLVSRLIGDFSSLDMNRFADGNATEQDFARFAVAASHLAKFPLHMRCGSKDIAGVRSDIVDLAEEHGCGLIGIDYLQKIQDDPMLIKQSRASMVTHFINSISTTIASVPAAGIVLSQLSRPPKKDKKYRPRLDDLRESGAIEQDAEKVGFLYPDPNTLPDFDEDEDEEMPAVQRYYFDVAKHRDGPTGRVPVIFNKPCNRFEPEHRIEDENVYEARSDELDIPETF